MFDFIFNLIVTVFGLMVITAIYTAMVALRARKARKVREARELMDMTEYFNRLHQRRD